MLPILNAALSTTATALLADNQPSFNMTITRNVLSDTAKVLDSVMSIL